MKQPLTGILPVAPTPFHDDGRIDSDGMCRVIDCMIDQGVDAICILANYSEQFLLSDDERSELMRVSLEHAAGRVPIIVTISHFHTGIVVARAKAAQAMGAAMVMMMPPYHGVGLVPAEAGIFEHFQAVSDAISIPIMVQDAPLSGCTLSVPLLVRMARELEQVSYFKMEMPFAADKLAALIEAGGDDIVGPFDGEEAATLLADLDAGCTGTMTSALQPEHIGKIVRSYLAGDKDAALAQWATCLPLINHENRQCGLRATKVVMKEGGVIGSDHVRHPLKPMSERTKDRLLQLSRDMDLIALRWGR
ncbi:dihydrodipicolinate synthase family protein [Ponticoccus sp. SC2-23]|uniref:dihydrodipicolinate synthase family protein n=1 Tax=Alexandriicola marinus TaxID=2081710 RepID=UPI000FD6E50B|nr:dihydrodipicolinate synthase family protein [Alexandriicola marinus]MBM1220896.1 dihydrodipicolinate synthase family protein [Ponticoccus sp. SC6-9]MBM1225466.1 dihydrodipicolinate synthase family protein [Ponticoccus sp. SC6-15]MBM1227649.1 dihydrodipicolinate synthase family protein [Ponticoccus sp. SC6-38]MBM1234713.1 dihydrodipicolinate synthase family protein [Ponticoccus sp. SC6-45]MBM1238151.1 dihydrodipicolinate synthase family protein [Ponticoccus sp. SC6-49]MBM1244216.1 dihydrodi